MPCLFGNISQPFPASQLRLLKKHQPTSSNKTLTIWIVMVMRHPLYRYIVKRPNRQQEQPLARIVSLANI